MKFKARVLVALILTVAVLGQALFVPATAALRPNEQPSERHGCPL
jgi:hypothetical protein